MTIRTATARPEADEHAPYYAGYINQVPEGDILDHLSTQVERTLSLLAGVTTEQAVLRPAPDQWSINEVICHVADTERIFSYRALRIGRGDTTPLPGFNQEPYVEAADANTRPLADLLAEFAAVRQATIWLFRSLPEAAWDRRGRVGTW